MSTKLAPPGQEPVSAAEIFGDSFFERAEECSVEAWLAFLGHRWNALILYHLHLGMKRFGELQACIPSVTPKVLSERLTALERWGLVKRIGGRGEPYELTPMAWELGPILDQLELWARNFPAPKFNR